MTAAKSALILFLFALTPIAPAQPPGLAVELAAARQAWIEALQSKNLDASVALHTPEATFLDGMGNRIQGAQNLRTLYKSVTSTFDADCHLLSRAIDSSGDLAFDSGDYEETMAICATKTPTHHTGNYLTIYHRSKTGKWLITQQMWTETATPQKPSGGPR